MSQHRVNKQSPLVQVNKLGLLWLASVVGHWLIVKVIQRADWQKMRVGFLSSSARQTKEATVR